MGFTHEESPSPLMHRFTSSEEAAFATELVKLDNPRVHDARLNVATGKAGRDEIRSYLQEKKARLRVFGKGDWVLRLRKRDHKGEPFYDGPFIIAYTTPNNAYVLRTPGGFTLQDKRYRQQLFPAFDRDGRPVRSLWYGSKK